MDKLIIVDYSCHPFSLNLAKSLANKYNKIYYVFSKEVNLTGNYYKNFKKKNLHIIPISVGGIPKHNFIIRRTKEIIFGQKIKKLILKLNTKKILLANMPIDPLYRLIIFCKKNKINSYLWMQDIYFIAIKNYFKKNLFLFLTVGYFIYKLYYILEKYSFLNSTKNILITDKFLKFFPKRKNNFVIENWVPIYNKKIIKKKNNIFTFIYTGTLSYKHDSEYLIKLAKKNTNCIIKIYSNDKHANSLFKRALSQNIKNILLHKLVSYDKLPSILKEADVGLVNLSKNSINIGVPSKVLTYYSCGLPILGLVPLQNPVSKNIIKYKTGLVSDPTDLNKFLKNAKLLINNSNLRKKYSYNAKKYSTMKFDINKISKKFIKILKQ